jgi:HPt (histidine-containing phosphotransfer) domain-containing protein
MMPPSTHKPAFDRNAALARVGGDTVLLKELAELFREECPRSLIQLHLALERQDPKGVQNAAHGLKGAVSNFGAEPAMDAALCLERLGREAHLDEAREALADLEQALATLQTELADL